MARRNQGEIWLWRIQKTGIPKWVARSVSGQSWTETCGLPLLLIFEPHPFGENLLCGILAGLCASDDGLTTPLLNQ